MNDNLTKARPRRPRISQFKSVDDFWSYHTDHPDAFITMDATGIIEMAKKVRDRTQNPLSIPLNGEGAGGEDSPVESSPAPRGGAIPLNTPPRRGVMKIHIPPPTPNGNSNGKKQLQRTGLDGN